MGEEAMEGTDCRAKILSQDYRDFLIPGYREDIEVRLPKEKTCVQEGDFGLRVISADKEIVGDRDRDQYGPELSGPAAGRERDHDRSCGYRDRLHQ